MFSYDQSGCAEVCTSGGSVSSSPWLGRKPKLTDVKECLNDSDTLSRIVFHLMFPESQDPPPLFAKGSCDSGVAPPVFADLVHPKGMIRGRDVSALPAAMPEAAINKNGQLLS